VEILEEVVTERKMLREAPVRSMVTVVALECWDTGQWRSIDPGRAESEVEWRVAHTMVRSVVFELGWELEAGALLCSPRLAPSLLYLDFTSVSLRDLAHNPHSISTWHHIIGELPLQQISR
jgi:hypothetical protein